MNSVSPYLIGGFVFAGVVGLLGNVIFRRLNSIRRMWNEIFNLPPVPSLNTLQGLVRRWGVSTFPGISPIAVITRGCAFILLNLLAVIGVVVLLFGVTFYLPVEYVDSGFIEGVFWAGYVGFILSQIRASIAIVRVAFARIVNPPNPSLTFAESPNRNNIAARPPYPPCSVVMNSIGEIFLFGTWAFILIVLLIAGPFFGFGFISKGTIGGGTPPAAGL